METSVPYDVVSTSSGSRNFLTKCCCFIPLRIGCFILGYMNLIFNTIHTLALVTLTTYIGITTHGFDHFDPDGPRLVSNLDYSSVAKMEKPFLNEIGVLLMVVVCANVGWLVVNVACLIGLHKKRPGPIRMYILLASIRLLLSFAGFTYLLMNSGLNSHTFLMHSIDIGLAAYFILVYYQYAKQMEAEDSENPMLEVVKVPRQLTLPLKNDKMNLGM